MRKCEELIDPGSCLNKARNDELLFVLLERDRAFPATVRFWAEERIRLQLNLPGDPKIVSARAVADEVENMPPPLEPGYYWYREARRPQPPGVLFVTPDGLAHFHGQVTQGTCTPWFRQNVTILGPAVPPEGA